MLGNSGSGRLSDGSALKLQDRSQYTVSGPTRRSSRCGACGAAALVISSIMELLWRFLLGGALVSLFALVGDVLRPKRFAGIFGGAPSIALATLALTTTKSGALTASLEARSMILSSLGFVLYVYLAQRALATGRWSPMLVAVGGLGIWGFAAVAAALILGALDA